MEQKAGFLARRGFFWVCFNIGQLHFNLGIGTTGPSAKLEVKGSGTTSATYGFIVTDSTAVSNLQVRDDGYGYLRAAAWAYGSDRRLKGNIKYFGNGLSKIMQLKPARFDRISGEKNQLGFIAQDVQEIIPEAVTVADNQTGYLGLKTDFIIPYLVNAIKEQQKEIESLKQQIADRSAENAAILQAISTLQANQKILESNQKMLEGLQQEVSQLKAKTKP
jgi:hypothetical protein